MATRGKKATAVRNKLSSAKSKLKRAVSAVKKKVVQAKQKLTRKKAAPAKSTRSAPKKVARAPKRQADIPMAEIAKAYTPLTSMKAGFRADGRDQEKDQEFAGGISDDRWKDEDRFTNKSGDPRIGTHGRTYEPGEKKTTRPKKGGQS